MKHGLWHIIGCLAPLLLLFLLPTLGISNNVAYVLFFVLMFACHLMMMGGHGHGKSQKEGSDKNHSHQGGCH